MGLPYSYCCLQNNTKHGNGVASRGILFMNLVKTDQKVKKKKTEKDKCIHTITNGDRTSLLFSLKGSACGYMTK